MDDPRIAVAGSGPSGLYTVAAQLASGQPLHIDVIDRMPTPRSAVRDVHILIRRGPADVKFTPELFQLSELADTDVVVHNGGDGISWLRLEEYEGALGAADGRDRVKVDDLESMLRYCVTSMRQ